MTLVKWTPKRNMFNIFDDVDQIMHVLENLERIYLIEVMTGPTWETTWTKQNA